MFRSSRFLLLGAALLAGCAVERRYAVLSFFFDGVPPPGGRAPPQALERDDRGIVRKLVPTEPTIPHEPYRKRECGRCHSNTRSYFIPPNADRNGLCLGCHEHGAFKEWLQGLAYTHGPAALQACLACHRPHDSRFPSLARAPDPELCYRCHVREEVLAGKSYHDLTEEKCLPCHDPHGGKDRYFLKHEGTS